MWLLRTSNLYSGANCIELEELLSETSRWFKLALMARLPISFRYAYSAESVVITRLRIVSAPQVSIPRDTLADSLPEKRLKSPRIEPMKSDRPGSVRIDPIAPSISIASVKFEIASIEWLSA